PTGFNNKLHVTSLITYNNIIFAGTHEGNQGVFFSTDEGISWTGTDTNFAFINDELFVYNNYLFLISNSLSIWRRPISEFSAVDQKAISKNELILHPNYPNPFSTQTTISFSNNKREFIDAKIFDLLVNEYANFYSGKL